jgi:signal transduction histidine kinase
MSTYSNTDAALRATLHIVLLAREWWLKLNFSRKLAGVATVAVCCGVAIAGNIATYQVRTAMVRDSAASIALYMDSFIAPHVQELANAPLLSEDSGRALASLLAPTAIGKPVVGFRIWADQRIVFSNDRNLVGKRFARSPSRDWAWAGNVYADPDLDSLDGDDDAEIRALGVPILEVYAPVHQSGTGRIIALVETYQLARELQLHIWATQAFIWALAALSAAAISVLLFAIARSRDQELSHLCWENEQHRARISGANQRVLEMSELRMRQMSTDLYDGPMQLVGLALLRLDSLHEQIGRLNGNPKPYALEIERIRSALSTALDDIRHLCQSLVPAKINALSIADSIALAARRHEHQVGRPVSCRLRGLPDQVPLSLKACIYRFVQEGLSAYSSHYDWYAVRASSDQTVIEVRVLGGPMPPKERRGLLACDPKLRTLRDRVEALGGGLLIQSAFGIHSITARFSVWKMDATNV